MCVEYIRDEIVPTPFTFSSRLLLTIAYPLCNVEYPTKPYCNESIVHHHHEPFSKSCPSLSINSLSLIHI